MWHKNQGDRDAFDRRQINEWITNSRVPFLYADRNCDRFEAAAGGSCWW